MSKKKPHLPWPKLSQSLEYRNHGRCQRCNVTEPLTYWMECDEQDQPTPVFIVLCKKCADAIIEPHPRLYREQEALGFMPGVMAICKDCPARAGMVCVSPVAKFNGGPGLKFEPLGNMVHVCRSPRSKSGWIYMLPGSVTKCSGKDEASAPLQSQEVKNTTTA